MMSSFVLRVTTKAQFLIIMAIGVSLGAYNSLDPASKKDLDWLQGTWKLVSAMRDGGALPEDEVKKTTIVIKDDTFLFPELADDATSKQGTIRAYIENIHHQQAIVSHTRAHQTEELSRQEVKRHVGAALIQVELDQSVTTTLPR